MNADETFEKLAQDMLSQFLKTNPDYATQLGLHEPYDYLLPKGGTDRLVENLRFEEDWVKCLKDTVKFEDLNEDHKVDWKIIERFAEESKFHFYERKMHELNPDAFEVIGALIFIMFSKDYAPLEKRADAIASRLEKTPKFLEEFHSRFEKSKPVKLWTEIAIESAQSIGGLFQFILYATKGQVSEKTHQRLTKAVENLQPILKKHLEWLKSLLNKAVDQWALGKDKFEKLIEIRDLGMDSEEILEIGEKYLKELKVKRAALAKQIDPEKSEAEVMKAIENNAPKTFDEALEATRKAMDDAKRFVQENDLATIYPEDTLLVEETPAFLAPIIPFAALSMPAKFDRRQIGIYIVTRPKDLSNLGKHLNYNAIKNTAVHEAYPGHFLQGAASSRGSFIRILAEGTETAEGWAHYCEEMMTEKGFTSDRETKFIQVNDVIWRAVRIIVDVKLSRGEMKFDEAVNMLVNETGMSREGATAEVRRYTMTPSYSLSYLLGKHLIVQLKEDIKKKMGTRFTDRFFNDTIASNGYMPLSMLRQIFEQKIGKA